MRTRTINLYTFDELDAEAKEKARDWYRKAFANDSHWHEGVVEDAKKWLAHLGYEVNSILWSGFWSQGDGACFTGSWSAARVNLERFKVDYGYRQGTPPYDSCVALENLAEAFPDASATLTHRGHYSHERSVVIDCEFEFSADGETEEETRARHLRECDFEAEFVAVSQNLMRFIYSALEKEYDYQNSDEQVDENIRANEYEFLENGEPA